MGVVHCCGAVWSEPVGYPATWELVGGASPTHCKVDYVPVKTDCESSR